ncbi:PhzF family phenazine biosynthesis protein [Pseudoduganella plicata]|uniref:Phenazine biosynthesis family protein n=1 Tax=Pseudoduganella plicata TaxID=321984 RepID=A0A4P7BGG3_9BURK|nr:PhzF family phenazine biosynthesis protein [Pseudoduganella plicata]QBQ36539.1 PhzF family phenazine biosynthesis protein [Pseudoduganella plicata]GGY74541.1 phenazine biosynthesis family protein [Pseudoduganella plicata]
MIDEVTRVAAFCAGEKGGNPAGVWIGSTWPEAAQMQAVAAQVNYSETVFAVRADNGWRVRYFSPESEVPFCGHATIALGAVLALQQGDGVFPLTTNHVSITVQGTRTADGVAASLQSPPTSSAPVPQTLIDEALVLFGYTAADLDPRLAPALANGGAGHLIIPLNSRAALAAMRYDLDAGRMLMLREGFATIALVHAGSAQRFHARNPFASGGVYEDPATGAAAAALAGYLRDADWPHGGAIDIVQGEDMGVPCHLHVDIGPEPGSSVQVSGSARLIG